LYRKFGHVCCDRKRALLLSIPRKAKTIRNNIVVWAEIYPGTFRIWGRIVTMFMNLKMLLFLAVQYIKCGCSAE
jgi:hypothetical protein